MPNGSVRSPKLWCQVQSAFDVIAPAVRAFVDWNALAIQYYYHEFAHWDIFFLRKIGGIGKITVSLSDGIVDESTDKVEEGVFRIVASWSLYEYKTFMRHDVHKVIGKYRKGQGFGKLIVLLEAALWKIDSWGPKDLVAAVDHSMWREHCKTENEFKKIMYDDRFDKSEMHYGRKAIR